MRIISGFLKGKAITFEKNIITRPLKDSVRENIFNILNHSNLIDVKLKNSVATSPLFTFTLFLSKNFVGKPPSVS